MKSPRGATGAIIIPLVVAAWLGGCQAGDPGATPIERPVTLLVEMREMQFNHPPVVSPGRVVITARNVGAIDHRVSMLPLPEDFPPIDVQLHSDTRRVLAPIASTRVVAPGDVAVLAVDLTPGRYAFVCNFRDASSDVPHSVQGMNSEIRVLADGRIERGGSPTPSLSPLASPGSEPGEP